jgi:hypothetical protein
MRGCIKEYLSLIVGESCFKGQHWHCPDSHKQSSNYHNNSSNLPTMRIELFPTISDAFPTLERYVSFGWILNKLMEQFEILKKLLNFSNLSKLL